MSHDLPPDDLLFGDPALTPLLRGLTAEATPGELARQDTVLEGYRAFFAPGGQAERSRWLARGASRLVHGPGRRARDAGWRDHRVRLATVSLAVLAGCGIAAYLLFVPPGARRDEATQPGPRSTFHAIPPGSGGGNGSSIEGHHPPQELGTLLQAWAEPEGKLIAGRRVVITADLTSHGKAVQGTELGLYERAADQRRWRLVTMGRTGARGTVMLAVRGLTTNARFRVKDAGSDASKPVSVVVVVPVTLRLHVGKHGKRDVLLVRCRFALVGDVVRLQVRQGSGWQPGHGQPGHGPPGHRHGNVRAAGGGRAGHPAGGRPDGRWQTIGTGQLSANGTASFEINRHEADLVYRVVLLATTAHGRSVSNVVVITAGDLHARW